MGRTVDVRPSSARMRPEQRAHEACNIGRMVDVCPSSARMRPEQHVHEACYIAIVFSSAGSACAYASPPPFREETVSSSAMPLCLAAPQRWPVCPAAPQRRSGCPAAPRPRLARRAGWPMRRSGWLSSAGARGMPGSKNAPKPCAPSLLAGGYCTLWRAGCWGRPGVPAASAEVMGRLQWAPSLMGAHPPASQSNELLSWSSLPSSRPPYLPHN
jgi:hypothetical protein